MAIVPKGTTFTVDRVGYRAHYTQTGFTNAAVTEDDEIIDAFNKYYRIRTITPWTWLDSLEFYECELVYKGMNATRPSTSGTWILESGLNLDPRYRHKKLLDDYLTAANMKEDDNATNATYITCLGYADYNIKRVFITKAVDLIFVIDSATMTVDRGYDKTPIHNIYDVIMYLYAIDKSTITATRLIRAAEHELQTIFEAYPTGSLRSIGREDPNEQDIGECMLWSKKVTGHYKIGISG